MSPSDRSRQQDPRGVRILSRITLNEDHNGSVVEINLGESISIRLLEVGGTAFLWHLTNAKDVELIDDHRDFGQEGVGAAATRVLELLLNSVGQVDLELKRYRPWESASDADSSFAVTVVVAEPVG